MKKLDLHKPVSQDVSYGALLGLLLSVSFIIVIPTLQAMREMPMAYYYNLPSSNATDLDRDGIIDAYDGEVASVKLTDPMYNESEGAPLTSYDYEV